MATTTLVEPDGIRVFPATHARFDDVRTMVGPKNPTSSVCWCLSHRIPAKDNTALAGQRGAYVEELTRRRTKPGVLAYDGDEVVGWAAVAPRADLPFARSTKIPHVDDQPAWSVWCIRVRPGHRGRGISHVLLDGAVAYAAQQGAPVVEGYPVDNRGEKVDLTMAYVGTRELFEDAGFELAARPRRPRRGFPRVIMRPTRRRRLVLAATFSQVIHCTKRKEVGDGDERGRLSGRGGRSGRRRHAGRDPPGHRALLPLPRRAGRPRPHDRARPGVLHDRRAPPPQRPGLRHERVPARPRALPALAAQPPRPDFQPHDFAPRAVFGRYIESLLTTAAEFPGNARLVRRRAEVVDIAGSGDGFVVELSDGERIEARAVVLATGSRPGTDWAPAELAADPRLVADPWTQGIPEDGDVLMLGSGLTMVDLAISADRPGRTVHVVSRNDAVPQRHVLPTTPPVPPPPGITRTQGLDALRSTLAAHVEATVEAPATGGPPSTACAR